MRMAGISSFKTRHLFKAELSALFLRTSVRDLPLLLSAPTRRHWTGRGRPTYVVGPPTDGQDLP
jgi:hypothetical protein